MDKPKGMHHRHGENLFPLENSAGSELSVVIAVVGADSVKHEPLNKNRALYS
jgi:hypothetical protein